MDLCRHGHRSPISDRLPVFQLWQPADHPEGAKFVGQHALSGDSPPKSPPWTRYSWQAFWRFLNFFHYTCIMIETFVNLFIELLWELC